MLRLRIARPLPETGAGRGAAESVLGAGRHGAVRPGSEPRLSCFMVAALALEIRTRHPKGQRHPLEPLLRELVSLVQLPQGRLGPAASRRELPERHARRHVVAHHLRPRRMDEAVVAPRPLELHPVEARRDSQPSALCLRAFPGRRACTSRRPGATRRSPGRCPGQSGGQRRRCSHQARRPRPDGASGWRPGCAGPRACAGVWPGCRRGCPRRHSCRVRTVAPSLTYVWRPSAARARVKLSTRSLDAWRSCGENRSKKMGFSRMKLVSTVPRRTPRVPSR